MSPQYAAGAFGLGVAGCARLTSKPTSFLGPSTQEHAAWRIVGQILFWTLRARSSSTPDNGPISTLWIQLRNEAPLAAADALYRLVDGLRLILDENEVGPFDLVTQWRTDSEPLLLESLENRTRLTSVFGFGGSKDSGLVKYLIESLGKVASRPSIPILKKISDDAQYGDVAILAIQRIRKSSLQR